MSIRVALVAFALGCSMAAQAAGIVGAPAGSQSGAEQPLVQLSDWPSTPPARSEAQFRQTMLVAHNRLRQNAGVAPLAWNAALAADAERYARQLAAERRFAHARQTAGQPQGENLWMGTARAFAYNEMTASWADEGEAFQRGRFPQVSRTGSWQDVGHYTQMIWGGTKAVGCAIASNDADDVLVCRYAPAGNVYGHDPLGF